MSSMWLKSRKLLSIISAVIFLGVLFSAASERVPVTKLYGDLTENTGSAYARLSAEDIMDSIEIEEIIIVPEESIDIPEDVRVTKIRNYFARRRAPLAEYAHEFVKAADHYSIDYRIVAAISIIESGGGKKNFRPHNAWGWGKGGFNDWTEGIWSVSAGISKYYSRGLKTPKLISRWYCPPNAEVWGNKVQGVMNVMAM